MAKPIPSGIPSNLLVTSAALKYNGVDIGLVSGVKQIIKDLTTPVTTDQFGKTEVNDFYVGQQISVEVMLDEFTVQRMKTAYPKATFITNGSVSKISWGRQVGEDYLSTAFALEVIPTSDDTTFFGRYFKWWKAAPIGDSSIEYGPDKKIQIKTVFKIYPDVTQPTPLLWFGYMGDATAGTLVPSTTGSIVYGGSNVGDGTIGSFSTNDSFTKTETWTATCIVAAANGGVFSVVGSVTGARGNATVGSPYHSNVITPANSEVNFTIADGATDWAVADTITFVSTAANYT